MRLGTLAANTTMALASGAEYRRLVNLSDLAATQRDVLTRIVTRNQHCRFGQAHRFSAIRSVADFQAAVPLSDWDDYAAAAARIAAGARDELTSEPVRLLEPSSGSTAAVKLVPYTAGLRADFQRGVQPWLHDLYTSFRPLRAGRSYWSITPAAQRPSAPSVVPIGFEDDADYLGRLARPLVRAVFAVDRDVAHAATMDDFKDRTCRQLLAAADLSLVSVWNPSFLSLLLDWIIEHSDRLLPALPTARRDRVQACLADQDWPGIWPQLGVVSCWADAAAAAPAAQLAARLPGIRVQPKGLLATEGFVTVPLEAAGGPVLSARSHFFEFIADGSDEVFGADQLEVGRRYQVTLTTSGGLYRYRLGDLVEVTGHFGELPMLRLIGRTDKVSDLVGEKLSEAFVTEIFATLGIVDAVLAPCRDHYVLHTDRPAPGVAERLDAALAANPHYDYARRLGQLRPIRVAGARTQDGLEGAGPSVRLGAVKTSVLGRPDHE